MKLLALFLALLTAKAALVDARDGMLSAHARVRGRLGLPPLEWSPELARAAQAWADHLAESGEFRHEADLQYGQNLYAIEGGVAFSWDAVQAWAKEEEEYNPRTNTCSGHCGHYTQMVWKTTKELGCAKSIRGDRQVWVCDYWPRGNIRGERPY